MKNDNRNKVARKSVIAEYWARNPEKGVVSPLHPVPCDWGEPSCWACGYYDADDFANIDYKTTDKNIFKCWDRAHFLERCHISPRSLTLNDHPSNLFLLCAHCHFESPDTLNPKNFERWLTMKQKTRKLALTVEESNEIWGVTDSQLTYTEDNRSSFYEWCEKNHVTAFRTSTERQYSTFLACVAEYCEMKEIR
jgi:hypothetical protein